MTIIDLIIWLLLWHDNHGGPDTTYEPTVGIEDVESTPARQFFADVGREGFVFESEAGYEIEITPPCEPHRRSLPRRPECT